MGTDGNYFAHYRFGGDHELKFSSGGPFQDLYDAVLGADVARTLGYKLGDSIIVAHGVGNVSFAEHKDKPFRVVGILAPTGTPVDRTVHVSLEAITAIHIDWQSGMQAPPGYRVSAAEARHHDLTPDTITAFLVGMRSRVMTFTMQRAINDYRQEPLLAILPGVALSQLWELVGVADTALMIVAAFVVLRGPAGNVDRDSHESQRATSRNGRLALSGGPSAPHLCSPDRRSGIACGIRRGGRNRAHVLTPLCRAAAAGEALWHFCNGDRAVARPISPFWAGSSSLHF